MTTRPPAAPAAPDLPLPPSKRFRARAPPPAGAADAHSPVGVHAALFDDAATPTSVTPRSPVCAPASASAPARAPARGVHRARGARDDARHGLSVDDDRVAEHDMVEMAVVDVVDVGDEQQQQDVDVDVDVDMDVDEVARLDALTYYPARDSQFDPAARARARAPPGRGVRVVLPVGVARAAGHLDDLDDRDDRDDRDGRDADADADADADDDHGVLDNSDNSDDDDSDDDDSDDDDSDDGDSDDGDSDDGDRSDDMSDIADEPELGLADSDDEAALPPVQLRLRLRLRR